VREEWKFGGVLVLTMMVLLSVLGSAFALADYIKCSGFERSTGITTLWNFGCYANVDGKWVPQEYVYGNAHELRKGKDK
jgi:hypothetical protein